MKKNKGVALAVCLVLTSILTLLAISVAGSVVVEERISLNTKAQTRTYVAADSGIQENWSMEILRKKMVGVPMASDLQGNYDQDTSLSVNGAIELEGRTVVCYMGSDRHNAGNEVDVSITSTKKATYEYQRFFVSSFAEETETKARSTIETAGFVLMPATSFEANCTVDLIGSVTERDLTELNDVIF